MCEECDGKRFTAEVLEYTLRGKNISEVLDLSVDAALEFFDEKPARAILARLSDVGLGYLGLGQALNTLSGGERQRLKLAISMAKSGSIYVLDEPTTGLHLADVDKLLALLDRLVDDGNTVIVIEHHQAVMAHADWIIDLGPGAGHDGGRVVFEGTPSDARRHGLDRCRDPHRHATSRRTSAREPRPERITGPRLPPWRSAEAARPRTRDDARVGWRASRTTSPTSSGRRSTAAWSGCAYCGATDRPLQRDCVLPISRGGRYTLDNVVPACGSCNASKCNDEVTGVAAAQAPRRARVPAAPSRDRAGARARFAAQPIAGDVRPTPHAARQPRGRVRAQERRHARRESARRSRRPAASRP